MSKKLLLTLFRICLLLLVQHVADAQPTGPATIFDYDQNGQRVLRYLNSNTVLKQNGDTLSYSSPADTLKRGLNNFRESGLIIKAYPNPAVDEVIVENLSWKQDNDAQIKLFDITGKFISAQTVKGSKERILLSSVVPGTYQINYYVDHVLLTSWKIIKQ